MSCVPFLEFCPFFLSFLPFFLSFDHFSLDLFLIPEKVLFLKNLGPLPPLAEILWPPLVRRLIESSHESDFFLSSTIRLFDLPKAGLKTVDGFLTRVEVGGVKVLLAFFTLILETEKKKVFS